jgi:tripartite-type tricarboxylate transporter receptor subunit TctC
MLMRAAGVQMLHVPYRGAAPAITDVIGGQVPVIMINVDVPLPHVRAGRLRVLAVTSEGPSELYPDVPTIASQGFPGFSAVGWMGISAPAGTPPDIVARLHDAITEALRDPQLRERFAAGGYVPARGSSADYAAFIGSEIAKWGQVSQALGIVLE